MDVDLSIYDKDIVISVLHRLSNIFTAKLESKNDNKAEIIFVKVADGYQKENLDELIIKELNDQVLRVKISADTESVRNLILAHAFSKTDFVKDNG